MIKRLSVLAVACALTAAALPAVAQDASLTANFGERRLSNGFTPDPLSIDIIAGGSLDASRLGESCVGKISTAPDYKLTYRAGALPLVFRTRSDDDTTLAIQAPDGAWHCDDDNGGDGNAEVSFTDPQSGVYTVWTASYGDNPVPGALIITQQP